MTKKKKSVKVEEKGLLVLSMLISHVYKTFLNGNYIENYYYYNNYYENIIVVTGVPVWEKKMVIFKKKTDCNHRWLLLL